MARGYCCASLVMLSEFLLWASAIGLALCGYILTQRDVIALVGVAVPQVAMGLGALALIIAIWGRISDYRRWQCGFYIMAISLIFLFLAEVLVVGYAQLQNSEWDKNNSIWDDLTTDQQEVVQSNYECCGWVIDEEVTSPCDDPTNPYHLWRQTTCKSATEDDYESWVMAVTIIFSSFGGFHLLYTCIPCLGQAKRLQMKAHRQEEANKKVVQEALKRNQHTGASPRGSWFFRKSPRNRQKNVEQELRTANHRNAPSLGVPHGAASPSNNSTSMGQPSSHPGSPV